MVLYPCISVIYQPYTQSTPAHPSAHPHVDNLFVLYFFCAVFRISSIFFVLFGISISLHIIFHGIISLYFCHIIITLSLSTPAHPSTQPCVFYLVFLLCSILYFFYFLYRISWYQTFVFLCQILKIYQAKDTTVLFCVLFDAFAWHS